MKIRRSFLSFLSLFLCCLLLTISHLTLDKSMIGRVSAQPIPLYLSELPDFSQPVERKLGGLAGTIVTGFRYNPSDKEIGILLSNDYFIKPIIDKQGEVRPRNTDYNRVTIKNFKFNKVEVGRRELLVDARIRYEKLEDKPWPFKGRYTTFDDAADITLGANFEVENRQLKSGTYVRRFEPGWASGPLGFIFNIFDAAVGVIGWVADDDFVRISDGAGNLTSTYVNLAQPQKELVNSLFTEVNDWNSKGLVYLNRTDYDPDGIWLLFKADLNQAQQLWKKLGNLVNGYFPNLSINDQLSLVASNGSTAPSSSSQSVAACSSTYDPRPYRPGTSGWNGRVGQIAFNNGTSTSVKVTLFHPDAPASAFNSWNVQPKQNLYLGGDSYGMDWGIQVNDSPICIVGSVSDWNSFNGSHIFQTWVERVSR
jgi:hypothetical protein